MEVELWSNELMLSVLHGWKLSDQLFSIWENTEMHCYFLNFHILATAKKNQQRNQNGVNISFDVNE